MFLKSDEVVRFFSLNNNTHAIMGNHERKHLNGTLSYAQEITKIQFLELI